MIKLRPATTNDLPVMHAFLQGIIAVERPMDACLKDDPIQYYDPADFIQGEDSELLVAHIGQEVIGCGAAVIKLSKDYVKHDQHLYLAMMYVAEAHRGKGVNGLIMDALIAWGKAREVTTCVLTVYPDNPGAIKAYEKLGFEPALLEMRLRS